MSFFVGKIRSVYVHGVFVGKGEVCVCFLLARREGVHNFFWWARREVCVCACVCALFFVGETRRTYFFLLAKKNYASTFDLVGENRSVCVCTFFFGWEDE
jgi:hypothetical protein